MTEIWLDLQTAFAVFVGPPLAFFMAIAIVGAFVETLLGFLHRPVMRVEIVRRLDGDE